MIKIEPGRCAESVPRVHPTPPLPTWIASAAKVVGATVVIPATLIVFSAGTASAVPVTCTTVTGQPVTHSQYFCNGFNPQQVSGDNPPSPGALAQCLGDVVEARLSGSPWGMIIGSTVCLVNLAG